MPDFRCSTVDFRFSMSDDRSSISDLRVSDIRSVYLRRLAQVARLAARRPTPSSREPTPHPPLHLSPRLGSPPMPRPPCSGRRCRPGYWSWVVAVGSPGDAVDPMPQFGSTPSTGPSWPARRPRIHTCSGAPPRHRTLDASRRPRPTRRAWVDAVDVPRPPDLQPPYNLLVPKKTQPIKSYTNKFEKHTFGPDCLLKMIKLFFVSLFNTSLCPESAFPIPSEANP